MLGVVLAGGHSQRLGTDKAELIIDGEPLWRRQLAVLRAAGATESVLVRRPDQTAPSDVTCWRDQVSEAGPMGGLHAALAPQTADFVAVLAVDMPGIEAGWFRWLWEFCRPGAGAMAQHAGACEPLAAIYPAGALAEIKARLRAGDFSLQRLARALADGGLMKLVPLAAGDVARVSSINTPEQFGNWNSGR
jgi:molybdopterin-guanine dinucleotide biosynthesis protein A